MILSKNRQVTIKQTLPGLPARYQVEQSDGTTQIVDQSEVQFDQETIDKMVEQYRRGLESHKAKDEDVKAIEDALQAKAKADKEAANKPVTEKQFVAKKVADDKALAAKQPVPTPIKR